MRRARANRVEFLSLDIGIEREMRDGMGIWELVWGRSDESGGRANAWFLQLLLAVIDGPLCFLDNFLFSLLNFLFYYQKAPYLFNSSFFTVFPTVSSFLLCSRIRFIHILIYVYNASNKIRLYVCTGKLNIK